MIILIILGAILFVTVVGILIAHNERAVSQQRQLNQRRRGAEQQIHEIGQRTRATILAEARRHQQRGQR